MRRLIMTVPFVLLASVAAAQNLSGDWEIISSVGGEIPITVHCTLIHEEDRLSGECTPVMENPEAAELTGTADDGKAHWGYEVVFNGNPGTVDFSADRISATEMSGTLSLSGTQAPFTAVKQ